MDYKEFFLTNNGSGWKTRDSLLKTKEPEIYKNLKTFINDNSLNDLPFKQQVWHFMNNDTNKKTCVGCGSSVSFKGTLAKGYREFCSLSCANTNGLLQDRATAVTEKKFGVKYFTQHESFMSKVSKTKLERYGDENYNNIAQCLKTKEELYGSKSYNNKNKNKLTTRDNLLLILTSKTSDKLIKYDIDDENITLCCSACNKNYEIYNTLFNYRTSVNVKPCTICNPIKDTNSIQEKELFEYVKSLLPNEVVINQDKSVISNINALELDVHIPSRKIAIELDGIHWHSDKFESDTNLLSKTLKCEAKGIQLIHVFEDEWIFKKDIVKSIIKSKLNLVDRKVFGRKCVIKEIIPEVSKLFLDTNHVQGNVNAKIKLGLYYNDELVSIMTFGSLRVSLGETNKVDYYEMYRFANKINTTVIGAFSKLLKYFITTYTPKSILSFSDNRYFTGDIYKNNGFIFTPIEGSSDTNYFYIINHKRENRFKYRHDILVEQGFDPEKTERQIMFDRGIRRIHDCGSKRWLLTL